MSCTHRTIPNASKHIGIIPKDVTMIYNVPSNVFDFVLCNSKLNITGCILTKTPEIIALVSLEPSSNTVC